MAVSSASDAKNESLNLVIANQNLYLNQAKWFDLLQYEGVAMTVKDKPEYSGTLTKRNESVLGMVRISLEIFTNLQRLWYTCIE